MKITEIKGGHEETWDIEVPVTHEYLLSNGCVSHNTSALLMKSTEGIEPIRQLVSLKTGTYSCKQLAPNLTTLRQDYDIAWNINSNAMIKLASVRQRFICQSQSFSTYYKDRQESAVEVLGDIVYAESQGVKSLYYAHTPKEDEEEIGCESCSV